MRVLVVGREHKFGLEASYARAFQTLGLEVVHLDPYVALNRNRYWRSRLWKRIFEYSLLERFNDLWFDELVAVDADVVFVCKGHFALPKFWRKYKSARPRTVLACYNPDDPITTFSRGGNRPWITDSVACFDLYCSYKAAIANELKAKGVRRVATIPFAWDPLVHPHFDSAEGDIDVVFVGNGDDHRTNWLSAIFSNPKARHWQIAVYGNWKRSPFRQLSHVTVLEPVEGSEMAQVLSSSKIALNILRKQNEGSHNMRSFEIPGSGGLLASQYSPEQDSFFRDRCSAAYFDTPEEAVEIINRLLADKGKRLRMKAAGSHTARGHTYVDRAQQFLSAVDGISRSLR